jgi:cholera toxin transcriptional activator
MRGLQVSRGSSLEESEVIVSGSSAGDCYYDAQTMTLSRSGRSVCLGSNESDLLLALIDGITDKEQLISRVWGDRGLVISDSSYYKTLHMLRAHFADVGLPRDSLKTLPRRGVVLLCEIRRTSGDIPDIESVPRDEQTIIVEPAERERSSARLLLPVIWLFRRLRSRCFTPT